MIARALINLVSFLSTLILARFLTPADFGLVALATTMLAIISAVTDLSLANALIQHPSPTDDHFHAAWTLNFARAVLIGAAFAAAAWPVASAYKDPRLVDIMLLLAASVVMSGLANPKTVVFARDLLFFQDFTIQVSQKVAGFVVSVAIALIYHSYWALVLGTVAAQLCNFVISYVLLPYLPRFRLRHSRRLFSFSLWLTLGQILNTLNWKLDYLLIGVFTGRTALGFYSVGDNLASMPTREATMPITKVLFPGLARVSDDKDRLQSAYVAAQAVMTTVALPLGFGFALCAKPLVLLAMGSKWLPIVMVIQGLSSIFALQTLGSQAQAVAMAQGATRKLFFRDMASFIVRIPLILGGILLAGLQGVVIARMMTGLIAIGFNLYLVRNLIDISIRKQITSNMRPLIGVMCMSATVIALQMLIGTGEGGLPTIWRLAAFTVAGAIAYVGTLFLMWTAAGRPAGPEREVETLLRRIGVNRPSEQS